MFRKTTIVVLSLICFFATLKTQASEPNDYIIPGRSLLFNGTLSGLQAAHEMFDNGLNDSNCADCNSSRELIFLHAVTRIAMWAARDDSAPVDSVIEFAWEFDIEVLGDYWEELDINYPNDVELPTNQHDAYVIPEEAPDVISGIFDFIDASAIPEIDAVIAELNSISDSPGDRFRIFFHPDETGLENDLEVDYGEVLILKGLLAALKGLFQTQAAYDMYVDANDMLVEKAYGNCFNANRDLLDPHPDLLKVLPTANDSNDGAAVLAQARQDLINAINYYFDAIDYIRSEEDPQEDDLLYIDPNDDDIVNDINDRLITLRDSLIDDTVATVPLEMTKTYILENLTTTWELELVFDFIGFDAEGSFVLVSGSGVPSPWKITYFTIEDDELIAEMDYDVPGEWGGALFVGMISEDQNDITNGTFEYWGPAYGTIYNMFGQLVNTEVEDANIDLNPVFGSSVRYPEPVNPRDLLPEFDQWNGPQPGTMGHGLGDDATLGGIIPDMNQYDWQLLGDALQPGGLFYLDFVSPWQVVVDGNITDWTDDQLVLTDIRGDADDDSNAIQGVDIEMLYMAYDWENLYGAITFHDNISDSIEYWYDLYLSYSHLPLDTSDYSALDAIRLDIDVSGGSAAGSLYHMDSPDCYPYWNYVTSFDAAAGPNAVEFKIPFSDIPTHLPGRFILLQSRGWDPISYEYGSEWNGTHLKIGEVGTISGTVSYNGYRGAPIFVQAYSDPWDPEGSLVASTMITTPGSYTLEGIGLGWWGYVRAFTPLFGFNVFDLDALTIQDSIPVFLMYTRLDGVNLVLNNPTLLKKDVGKAGQIDLDYEEDWYSFYAVEGGTYTLDVNRVTSQYACMTLYGRDGHTELQELCSWQTQHIDWICPESGRYYVKVSNGYCQPASGTYQILMTSNITCPQSDIAGSDWARVEDCKVDFYDLAVLMSNWLGDCSEPYWCDDSDFDESGSTDFADFATLANEWLEDGML